MFHFGSISHETAGQGMALATINVQAQPGDGGPTPHDLGFWPAPVDLLGPNEGQFYAVRGSAREAIRHMEDLFARGARWPVEIACPMEWVERRRGPKRTRVQVRAPMLGGYFFVRADLPACALKVRAGLVAPTRQQQLDTAMRLGMIRAIEGVREILCCDSFGFPAPAARGEVINSLMRGVPCDALAPSGADAAMVFDNGAWVVATSGPFAGMVGQVDGQTKRLDKAGKTRVLMRILGGSVPAEFKTEHLMQADCADHPAPV